MERIKQALERAQTERGGPAATRRSGPATATRRDMNPGEGTSRPPGLSPRGMTAGDEGGAVNYTDTRISPLDTKRIARNRVIATHSGTPASAAYKVLRTQVLHRMRSRGWNAIAVTSSAPNEGKTLTAINLAIGLAQEPNHTAMLADFDLRNPSVLSCLGLEAEYGVVDHLLRDIPLSEVLINPGIDGLVVAPGTERVPNSSELLASPQTVAFVQELRARYPSRMLVFDLPPLLSADDALAFSPLIDAVLLVVEEGRTERSALRHSLSVLGDTPIIGTVLNKSKESGTSYYYY